jgi:hypothetical protein
VVIISAHLFGSLILTILGVFCVRALLVTKVAT